MDAIEQLLSQGFGSVIITVLLVLVAAKFIWELVEFFIKKFNSASEHIDEHEETVNTVKDVVNQLDSIEQTLSLVQERLQENTRSYLIDAHHKYVYEQKLIDDITLQSLERRYHYYRMAGGNSFITKLMEDIRKLPRTGISNKPQNIDLLSQWR